MNEYKIQARRQKGDIFILVIPADIITKDDANLNFMLTKKCDGFECVVESIKDNHA